MSAGLKPSESHSLSSSVCSHFTDYNSISFEKGGVAKITVRWQSPLLFTLSPMQPPLGRRSIPPKVSTVPRPKTEASAYLDLYQLAVEKTRLQQELQMLDVRKQQLQQRLSTIDQQMNAIKNQTPSASDRVKLPEGIELNEPQVEASPSAPFDTFLLEY